MMIVMVLDDKDEDVEYYDEDADSDDGEHLMLYSAYSGRTAGVQS